MLAAPFRRASRMVLGLTVLTAVSIGLSLAGTWAPMPSARAVDAPGNRVAISIFPTTGSSVSENDELAVTVSLVNNSAAALAAGQVTVTTESGVLSDASSLNDWLAAADGEQQPGRWLGVVNTPALPIGATVDVTATLPLTNAYYGSSWGPRGLAADLVIAGSTAGTGRGVLVWTTSQTPSTASLVTLLPVVTPASASGLLTADELTLLTAPQGALSSQLSLAAGRNLTLAVDPRIIASIGALAEKAPASAQAWLTRLKALPNESFALTYADADVALQAQAGASSLLTAGFSDQPQLTPKPTQSPSGSPTISPTSGAFSPVTADAAWAPTLSGFTWPQSNTVVTSDLAIFPAGTAKFSIFSSSNVASGANSAAHTVIGNQQAIVTNAGLSAAIHDASAASTEAQWTANFSLASAYLATTALNPATQRAAVVALTRTNLGDVSEARLAQILDRVSALPWVTNGTLGTVAASPSASATTITDTPESEDRVHLAEGILQRQTDLANFSTVLATPALLTDSSTRNVLALFSVAWSTSDAWPAALSTFNQAASTTLGAIHIVSSSEINMVGGQVNIPVTVENTLKLPVSLLVRATPSNARLSVDSDSTITIQGQAQGKALVPVKARVGNGSVFLSVTLYSPTGIPIGDPVSLPVNVRADWEGWGLGGLGVLFGALVVAGVVRTVRKRRHEHGVNISE